MTIYNFYVSAQVHLLVIVHSIKDEKIFWLLEKRALMAANNQI